VTPPLPTSLIDTLILRDKALQVSANSDCILRYFEESMSFHMLGCENRCDYPVEVTLDFSHMEEGELQFSKDTKIYQGGKIVKSVVEPHTLAVVAKANRSQASV
jgi:hypothetical protein